MKEDLQGARRKGKRLWLPLAVIVAILAAVIVPPMVSVSRYKNRITQLLSESLGRPVRLSSVEMRLLPTPGFVLTDLTVDEDSAFGAEPVLHANKVTASIRLMSLWRGRLAISSVSLDEASLNVVRTQDGRSNLDSVFRTAAANPREDGQRENQRSAPLPYLEATNSRINFKRGAEKLPFSLVETDLSFWQEQPGDWRIRLRGQPARTDLSLDLADTGVVRLEARVQRSPELRNIPLHLDLEWREAQLGQLARLVIGSDPGWRGDLAGEVHIDGTPDAAEIKTRLRATGVHRSEFAPAAPLDFDASCGFRYHFSTRAVENLVCDSPLGEGRIRLTGELPGSRIPPHLSVEVDRIPVAAGLDALRTVRSDLGPGLDARGTISGKISYAPVPPAAAPTMPLTQRNGGDKRFSAKARAVTPGPLTGSFTVQGFQLEGDGLNTPIQASRLVLEPVVPTAPSQSSSLSSTSVQPAALEATMAIPAGGATPLAVTARLALSGYEFTARGQASVARARELAHVAGLANAAALNAVAGDPVTVDLSADGPWLPNHGIPFSTDPLAGAAASVSNGQSKAGPEAETAWAGASDSLHGTVLFRNANWKADFLANHVQISQATLHLGSGGLRWDPVVFSYGPIKGTASLNVPAHCEANQLCPHEFQVQFGDLDAGALQAAILGAHEPGTLLSTLLGRFRPSSSPTATAWPLMEGAVRADTLILGPVTLRGATATLRIVDNEAEITGLDAGLLGGRMHGDGTLHAAADGGKPTYTIEGHLERLSPAEVGELLGGNWKGRSFDADGRIDLSGFTSKDLSASAKGTMHFEWQRGSIAGSTPSGVVPRALARFDRWTADAEIANGAVTLKQSQAQLGFRKQSVKGEISFGTPPKVSFALPKETQARR